MDPATIASIGAPILGGLLGFGGQKAANAANAQMAREQMRFQERMSNTSYQRSVEDMRRAGLNPALAYQKGGASTPGGAMATAASETAPLAAGVSSAGGAVAARQAFSLQKAETAARIASLGAQTAKTEAEAEFTRASTPYRMEEIVLGNRGREIGNYGAGLDLSGKQAQAEFEGTFGTEFRKMSFYERKALLENLPALQKAVLMKMRADTDSSVSSAQESRSRTRLNQLRVPEAEADASFFSGPVGRYSRYMSTAQDAADLAGSIVGGIRGFQQLKPRRTMGNRTIHKDKYGTYETFDQWSDR